MSIIPSGSSPFIGSSKIRKSGLEHKEMAIPSLWRIPSEKYLASFFPVLFSPTSSNILSTSSSIGRPIILYCTIKLSLADKFEYMAGDSIIALILFLSFKTILLL